MAVIEQRTRAGTHGADASHAARPTVFLDKDGTLIEDLPYNVDPDRIRLAPGSRAGIRLLGDAGFRIVIVTNQSGVARGYFTERDLDAVARHLDGELRSLGAGVDGFYFCPHLPDGINEYAVECECRKPEPGLIHRAVRDLGIDLDGSWFVGDTWMDVAAGRAAGCRTIMVGPEHRTAAELPDDRRPDYAVADLLAAARIIVATAAQPAVPA
ncbi:MAG TPA: HAD family hydrolase [Candidatus Limnocylindrales bacterium]|nr:HAD family hydrolase [Candidatus Limnocylindrales bacterium]